MSFADITRRPPALNPGLKQAVVSAVYSDLAEHERRSRNIVIHGLPQQDNDDRRCAGKLLCEEFGVTMNIIRCQRLGRVQSNRAQPLLVVLPSTADSEYFIKNARRLRESSNTFTKSSVFINADMTRAEALAAYQHRCRRREMMAARQQTSTTTNIGGRHTVTSGQTTNHQHPSTIASSSSPVVANSDGGIVQHQVPFSLPFNPAGMSATNLPATNLAGSSR